MRYRIGLWAVVVALMLFSAVAGAATRYISDEIPINMWSGPGTTYHIVESLDSGDTVQTKSESKGWTLVQTSSGKRGYVLSRFLSKQPAARTRIADAEDKADKLTKENEELKSELAKALHGSSELGEVKSKLVAENKSLKSKLQQLRETSADAVRISNENQEYREKMLSMRSEVERLQHENESLQSRRDGMKIGALILIAGILVGLILPLFTRRNKKKSWDSL